MYEFFFFNDTATTEIYPLSLHDALPILRQPQPFVVQQPSAGVDDVRHVPLALDLVRFQQTERQVGDDPLGLLDVQQHRADRSEEHTSELQSRQYLVCRLLLEKKKNTLNY